MPTKFWDELLKGLASQWTVETLGPVAVFWCGGLAAWASRYGHEQVTSWLKANESTLFFVALAGCALLVITASTAVVSLAQLPVLRLVEGYWPWPFRGLRFRIAGLVAKGRQNKDAEWLKLASINRRNRSAKQQERLIQLDAALAQYPEDPRCLMPTRLGNILRAAEEYTKVRFGLDIATCWPRLWLLLPQETQKAISESRTRLNSAVGLFVWSILFLVWVVWTWWAVLVTVVGVAFSYWAMLDAGALYAVLLRGAFDLYRFELYEKLHWPLPTRPRGEEDAGRKLSTYLFRGMCPKDVEFVGPDRETEA